MTDIVERAQQDEVGRYIDLFTLDMTPYGGEVVYWTPSTPSLSDTIVWGGNEYVSVDVKIEGFDRSTSGTMPKPQITVSNADNVLGALLIAYDKLLGCEVTYTQTLEEYLDGQPGADTTQYWPIEVYRVERPLSWNKHQIVLELSSVLDNANAKLPRNTIIQNTCPFIYRKYDDGAFDYTNATCPYTDTNYFKINGDSTSDLSEDVCGKRVSDCQKRFGQNAELPFGGFPGVSRS